MTEKKLTHPTARRSWALFAVIGVALLLAACDSAGNAPAGPAALAPTPPAAANTNPAPAVATAYWPNGKPNIPAAPAIPPAPALPAASGNILLADDFNAPTASNYTILDLGQPSDMPASNWQVQADRLTQQGDNAGNPATFETLALSPVTATSYRIEVEAYSAATPLGLVARYSAAGFYRLRVNRSGVTGPGWQLARYDASGRGFKITTLATGSVGNGYQIRQWNYLALTAQGSTMSVNLNGQTVASVADATYASGSVGLYTEATGGAFFDNLRVAQQ